MEPSALITGTLEAELELAMKDVYEGRMGKDAVSKLATAAAWVGVSQVSWRGGEYESQRGGVISQEVLSIGSRDGFGRTGRAGGPASDSVTRTWAPGGGSERPAPVRPGGPTVSPAQSLGTPSQASSSSLSETPEARDPSPAPVLAAAAGHPSRQQRPSSHLLLGDPLAPPEQLEDFMVPARS
eukprot:753350-Hanusia_phi.AAC.1